MANKEALEIIGVNTDYKDYSNETIYNVNEAFRILEDSIERLEELEKIIELIKNKKVNMFHIWAFNDYQQYEVHYPFSEYHAEKDMLTKEEYDLLKEVIENE